MGHKLLIIDDDRGLLTLLQIGLEQDGFAVTTAENGKEGLRKAYQVRPDVIVLDIVMTGMDGWTTCQRLRQVCDAPIIMLTASGRKTDVVKGLSMGADDYLTKPCSFDELRTRIYTLLRRTAPGPRGNGHGVYDDGTLCIDTHNGTVTRRGKRIDLTPTETRLLLNLVGQKGRIVPHKELLNTVWGPEYVGEANYLSVYIRYLRMKLEDDPDTPRYIHTRWKMGYCFSGSEVV
jgi:DNA-binding response OmpR family regulator